MGREVVGSDQKAVVLSTGLETYPAAYCREPQVARTKGLAIANPVFLAALYANVPLEPSPRH